MRTTHSSQPTARQQHVSSHTSPPMVTREPMVMLHLSLPVKHNYTQEPQFRRLPVFSYSSGKQGCCMKSFTIDDCCSYIGWLLTWSWQSIFCSFGHKCRYSRHQKSYQQTLTNNDLSDGLAIIHKLINGLHLELNKCLKAITGRH